MKPITDKNGLPLAVGDFVVYVGTDKHYRDILGKRLVVRAVKPDPTAFKHEVRADDGDPANPDIETNGHTFSTWKSGKDLVKTVGGAA